VTIRTRARGVVDAPDLRPDDRTGSVGDAVVETRDVVYDGDVHDTRIYDRERIPTDSTFDGPAIVEGGESTTVVHPGQRVRVDDEANLVVVVSP